MTSGQSNIGEVKIDCTQVKASMYLVRDDEGEDELLSSVREHLQHCTGCAGHFAYLCKLLDLVRSRCRRESAPDGLKHRILASFEHRRIVIAD